MSLLFIRDLISLIGKSMLEIKMPFLESQQCYWMLNLLLMLLIGNMLYISLRRSGFGSDHFIHKVFIDLIKKNRHRFINKIEPFLFGNVMGYPQLYHWILSYLEEKQIAYLIRFNSLFFNSAYLILHLLFTLFIINKFEFNYDMHSILVYSILLYLSCGALFNVNNARNAGLSPRNFGLLLGQLYVYLTSIYLIESSLAIFAASILLIFISFLTSQFTTQFIVFMSIFVALLFKNILPLVELLGAFCLFVLIFRKMAKNYLIFQWKHKKYFAIYGTKIYLLPSRYSIWGDFFSGFWKNLKSKDVSVEKNLWYIFNNPVLIVCSGAPIIMFLLYALLTRFSYQVDQTVIVLAKIFIGILMVFAATSFKYTRFLGEPERYIDFGVSMICVLGALVFYRNPGIILVAVFIGFGRIAIEGYLFPWAKRRYRKISSQKDAKLIIEQIRTVLKQLDNVRLMSNNIEITKSLLSAKAKFFYGWIFMLADRYDPYSLFKQHAILNDEMIIPLIKEYQITYFIQDTTHLKSPLKDENFSFNEIGIFGHIKLFSVCSKT